MMTNSARVVAVANKGGSVARVDAAAAAAPGVGELVGSGVAVGAGMMRMDCTTTVVKRLLSSIACA